MKKIYSQLKLFHYPEKLDSLPQDKPMLPPVHVRFKPTNRCNHNCRYCSYRNPDLQLGKDMSVADSIPREKGLEIARDFAAMGVKAVTFSGGGEPLAYPHLLEVARILRDGGVSLACLSNGGLLHGEKAEFLAHNAVWLRVSMDGWDDASYMRYRGVADGEFTKIMHNIENFSKLGGSCVLGVSYIVDKENCVHVRPMLERLKNVGVRSVKVSACIVSDDSEQNNAYHAPHFDSTEATIEQAIEDLGSPSFEIVNAWHKIDGRFTKSYSWCPFSQMLCVVAADQCVYPCQDKAYNRTAVLGNLEHQSFRNFWTTSKANFFHINPSKVCQHNCMANKKNQIILEYLSIAQNHLPFV